jgi:hypothetical protein
MSFPLALVMRWLAEPPSHAYPPGLFTLDSPVARRTLDAACDAVDTWRALRGACRGLRSEHGLRNLVTAEDIALEHLIEFEEWNRLARLGV